MMTRAFTVLAATAFLLLADEPPQGVPARPSPSDYAVHATGQQLTLAATLLPSKQVSHLFAFDISKTFIVFEVAFYADSAATKVSRDAFAVKSVHSSDADTVASTIQRQNQPPMPSTHGLGVDTTTTVGYERMRTPSGTYSGVYTGTSVSTENRRPDTPTQDPKPGGTSEDRRLLAAQLRARSLPEGPVHHTVAGYLFFRKSDLKAESDDAYSLQYLAEDETSGTTQAITLSVPRKTR